MVVRVVLLEASGFQTEIREHDIFEVVELADAVARVRTPYLFDVGEELRVRIERDGATSEATARVRAHSGPPDARITELELGS